jgi:hypothetical protein
VRVRLPSIPHLWHTGLLVTTRSSIRTCRLCSDAEFMRSVWQRYDALATNGDTGSASSARVFLLLISPSSAWSPHVPPCSASLRRCTVWVYLRATLNRTLMATTACTASRRWWRRTSATVLNVVGMIGTEAGHGVETAAMKVQWCVSLINVLPTDCQPFPVIGFFLLASINSTRQMRRSSQRRTYISLACNASSLSPTASRGIPSPSATPSRSKNHPRVQPSRACTRPLDPTALPETEAARAGHKLCARC